MELNKDILYNYLSSYFDDVISKFISKSSLRFTIKNEEFLNNIVATIGANTDLKVFFNILKKNVRVTKTNWVKNTIKGKKNSFAKKMNYIKENDIRYKEIFDNEVKQLYEWQKNCCCYDLTTYKYFEDKTFKARLKALESDITCYFLELIFDNMDSKEYIFRFQEFNDIPLALNNKCKQLTLFTEKNSEMNVYTDTNLQNVYSIVIPQEDLTTLKQNNSLAKNIFKLLNVTDVRVYSALFLNIDVNFFINNKINISLAKLTTNVFGNCKEAQKQVVLASLYKIRYLHTFVVSKNEPIYSLNQSYALDTGLIKTINRIEDELEIEIGDYPKNQIIKGNLDLICKDSELKNSTLAESLAFFLNNQRINRMNLQQSKFILTDEDITKRIYFGDTIKPSTRKKEIIKALELIKNLNNIIKDYTVENGYYIIIFNPVTKFELENMDKAIKNLIPSIVTENSQEIKELP